MDGGYVLALGTLLYLGALCHRIVLSASQTFAAPSKRALHLRELGHLLGRYLIMASLLTVTCTLTVYMSSALAEDLRVAGAASEAIPAQLALVVGLSFTGLLFLLFQGTAAVLEDATNELIRDAEAQAMPDTFDIKAWRERHGLDKVIFDGQPLQVLTLAAPALAALLTKLGAG